MNNERQISDSDSVLEQITNTVLYEGYSLFPYHRSSVKNQKPIPFGVIYPEEYQMENPSAPSLMQTECIMVANNGSSVNMNLRFLQLTASESNTVHTFGMRSQSGWQTVERQINSGDLLVSDLMKRPEIFTIDFSKIEETEILNKPVKGKFSKQARSVSPIKGKVLLGIIQVKGAENIFQLRVTVMNTSPVKNAALMSRDEAFLQSLLSTNTILRIRNGEFISDQNPPENLAPFAEMCKNIGTWPILVDTNNTCILSSPIILYDYPEINTFCMGDLFDSLEIQEALVLQLSAMSDKEKQQIAESDEKLHLMLEKVSRITPGELINLHGSMYENKQFKK